MNSSLSANFPAPLDPGFQPTVLFNRDYAAAAKKSGRAVPLVIGLERENKLISRYETVVLPDADATTLRYVERLVKFLLWAWGGGKLYIGGPKKIGEAIHKIYSPRGARRFDFDMMTSAYAKKFSGKYSHRTISGGVGHNLPQEAPVDFAEAVIEVDRMSA